MMPGAGPLNNLRATPLGLLGEAYGLDTRRVFSLGDRSWLVLGEGHLRKRGSSVFFFRGGVTGLELAGVSGRGGGGGVFI